MPYIPTVWVDEVPAESPVKYQITDEGAGLSSIQIQTPVIPGTPMNAANLNKIEIAIQTAQADVESAQAELEANAISLADSANSALKTYGNGGDGDVTISGVVLLRRNMYYKNLTISATGELKTMGWIVKVSGTLTITAGGKISANGNAGNAAVVGSYYSNPGGLGSWSSIPVGITPLPSGMDGGSGQAGGDIGNFSTGGTGGVAIAPPALPLLQYVGSGGGAGSSHGGGVTSTYSNGKASIFYAGYNGGNGQSGSGYTANIPISGASGGGGGGCMHLYINIINNQGSIEAKGGAGGARNVGSDRAGNGGGGGGGMILLIYSSITGSGFGTLSAAGGSAGGTGATAGSNGYYLTYQIIE